MGKHQLSIWTTALLIALALFVSSCARFPVSHIADLPNKNLQSAETLIDAFYSFSPIELEPLLSKAASSAPTILYYQGWAEGGNYKIVNRQACKAVTENVISCAITVQDDPVLALNIDFNVTDTFTITFSNTEIITVETSSNDKQIYLDAFNWVTKEMPEVMSGPCLGFFNGGPTPGDCARAMTQGYRKFINK